MGRTKALLPLGPSTFLGRVVAAFKNAGVEDVCVVTGGSHAHVVRSAAQELGCQVETNEDPSAGPISSIRVGIASAAPETSWFLFHPVDIPGITAQDVTALLDAVPLQPDAQCMVPSLNRRRGHPLLLTRELAERALDPAVASLRDSLAGVEPHYVGTTNESLFRNVNTPEEYETLLEAWPQEGRGRP